MITPANNVPNYAGVKTPELTKIASSVEAEMKEISNRILKAEQEGGVPSLNDALELHAKIEESSNIVHELTKRINQQVSG